MLAYSNTARLLTMRYHRPKMPLGRTESGLQCCTNGKIRLHHIDASLSQGHARSEACNHGKALLTAVWWSIYNDGLFRREDEDDLKWRVDAEMAWQKRRPDLQLYAFRVSPVSLARERSQNNSSHDAAQPRIPLCTSVLHILSLANTSASARVKYMLCNLDGPCLVFPLLAA